MVDTQSAASHFQGMGLWVPGVHGLITTHSVHGVSPSLATAWGGGTAGTNNIALLDSTGTIIGESKNATVVDNGNGTWSIVLTCDVAYTQALLVQCMIFGGAGAVDLVKPAFSTSTVLISCPSGQADALVLLSGTVTSSPGSISNDAAISVGIAARAGGQAVIATDSDHGRTASVSGTYGSDQEVSGSWSSAGALSTHGAVTAWNTDSIEVTRSSTLTRPCAALVFSGCNAKVVSVATRTDLTTDIAVGGLGWRPAGVLALSTGAAAWDALGIKRTTAHTVIGMADSGMTQGSLGSVDVHGQNPTVVGTVVAHSDLYVRQTETATPAAAAKMRLNGVNSDGLTLRMSVADDTPRQVALLVFGPDTSTSAALSGGAIAAGTITPTSVQLVETLSPGGGTAPYIRQLQRTVRGGSTWIDITGATAPPYVDNTATAGTQRDYRVKVTDSAGAPATVYSNTVQADTPTVLVAGTATLGTVTSNQVQASATAASAGTAPYFYQWQRTSRGGSEWANVAGQTGLALTDSSVLPSTNYDYRLRVTDAGTTPQVKYSNTLQANVPAGTAAAAALPAVERVETIPWGSTRPIEFELTKSLDGMPYTGALSVGDAQIDPGTGTYANVTNLPVAVGGRYRWTPTASETSHEAPVLRIDLTGTLRRLIYLRTEGHPDAYYGGAEAAALVSVNAVSGSLELRVNGTAGTFRAGDEFATSAGSTGRIDSVTSTGGGSYTLGLASPGLRGSATVGDSLRSYLAVQPDKTEYALSFSAEQSVAAAVAPDNEGVAAIRTVTDSLSLSDGAVIASLTDAERQALWNLAGIMDGKSPAEALKVLLAFHFGPGTGLDTDTPAFEAIDGSGKVRVSGVLTKSTRDVTLDAS